MKANYQLFTLLILSIFLFNSCKEEQEPGIPPFNGTISIDPDIIKPSDPSMYANTTPNGQGIRSVFDRRANDWITMNAFLFTVSFSDGTTAEAQVNPEFGSVANAQQEVEKYAFSIGQIPKVLRKDLETITIHKGLNPFGGGNNNLLIHTEQGNQYISDGILEETFVHEACHTSLDANHADSKAWKNAQKDDNNFISTYAQNNPTREDVAESFLMWLAVKYRSSRISNDVKSKTEDAIPNRLIYFDNQGFNMTPIN